MRRGTNGCHAAPEYPHRYPQRNPQAAFAAVDSVGDRRLWTPRVQLPPNGVVRHWAGPPDLIPPASLPLRPAVTHRPFFDLVLAALTGSLKEPQGARSSFGSSGRGEVVSDQGRTGRTVRPVSVKLIGTFGDLPRCWSEGNPSSH